MNVGGAPFESGEDGGVDQPDDGADVFFAGELLDGDVFVGVVVAGQHIEGEPFAGFVQNALRLLRLFQQVGDLRERGHAGDDAMAQQSGDLVQHHELRRIGDRDHQRIGPLLEGHEVVAEHQLYRDGAQQVVLNLEVLQVDELGAIARGEHFRMSPFVLPGGQRSCNQCGISSHIGLPRN